MTIPSNSLFKAPSFLPLEKTANKVRCLSCHDIHNSATSDGNLLRIANRNALCTDCHTLADTNQAAHLSLINGVLWPGGQYGTTYPQQTDAAQRGMCNNCHQPHGWPTNLTSSVDFTNLLVEARVTICLTCHDGSPAASTNSVIVDFTNTTKVARHAVRSSDPLRKASRPVDCTDCHNPHQARLGRSVYTNAVAMTSTRNLVVNPNVGVSGVVVNYALLANYAAPSTNIYTLTNSVVYEYQICFKCHSSYWSGWNTNSPPTGLSANGTVSTPIETDLVQSFNFNNRSGHPIVTGLNNFTNSYAPRNLATGSMKAPWAANVGTQTMLCTDCHNTDGNLAQGPHGSAAQFMLRGANAANWPNVDTANISTSWCVNCHNPNADIHTSGVHAGTVSGVAMRCYSCHIVIPHGGKMSRLIADRDGVMPVRYAYSNDKNNVQILQFKKISGTQSGDSQCNTACGDHLFSDPLSEDW